MLVMVCELPPPFVSRSFQILTKGMISRILFGFFRRSQLHLPGLFLPDQFGPGLDSIHRRPGRWSSGRSLFPDGNARRRTCA